VIIGEELAKSGINRMLDFLQRDIRMRSTTLIAVGQGDVKEILESQPVLGGITGLAIKESMWFNWERSKIIRKELYQMVRDVKEGDRELVLPIISMEGENIAIRNAAYFQNTTMKGILDNKQVLGLLWLVGDVRHGSITINPNPRDPRYITLELMDTKVEINPVEGSKGLVFHIKVDQQLRVTDDQTNLTVTQIEQEVNRYIKNTILETINLAKEEGIDFIGFGKRYRRKYPKKWDEDKWTKKFQGAEVIIKVNSIINREER
jgi:Ger(x)C family germination protein